MGAYDADSKKSARNEQAMTEPNDNLSPHGAARREAMLGELTAAMTTLHRRRRARRMTVGAATTALLCVVLFRTLQMPADGTKTASTVPPVPTRAPLEAGPTRTVYVHTDREIADRLLASPPVLVTRIDDTQLLRTLIEIGRPAGLIRFGDRVALSAPVTDEEITGR